ncbi:MAG: TRAP transporter small permease [Sneathiella sp.]
MSTPDTPQEITTDSYRLEPVPAEAGKFGQLVNRIGVVFAIGFLLSMAVLIYEIFMRHLFNAPTLWAHETTTFLCATGFVFGGLYCAAHNKHIRVVPLYDNVGPKIRRWLDVTIYSICAISTGFFSYAAWSGVERAIFTPNGNFRLETSGSAWNPPTPALLKIFLFVILVGLTIQFVLFAVAHLRAKPKS